MRARLIMGWLVVLTMVAAIGYAQQPPAVKLSLAEAIEIARANNPAYLQALAARGPASWSLTNATVSLFSPTASLSGGYAYQAATGGQIFQGFQIPATPSVTSQDLSLRLGYTLSGATITNRGYWAAQLRAADQNIAGARMTLETSVKTEYLSLLEARAQETLAAQQVQQTQELLNLAQAQFNVGQKTMIDVRQAQVTKGQADVGLLQAQQNVQIEVLKLYQILGVPAPEPPNVEPTDTFPVVTPGYQQDSLVALALRNNPVLMAYRAQEHAAAWNVRSAYSQYLPSLMASAGTGRQWISQGTRSYSLSNPWVVSLGVSLPLWDTFSRNVQIAQARSQRETQDQNVRAEELAVRANVSAAYLALVTAYQTIGVQANNRAAASEALQLAEEQYRVGSGDIIQLLTARVTSQQASVDYITAVYNYHKDMAALEQAVGQPLR